MQRLFLKNKQIVTVDTITDINFGVLFVLKFFRERERERLILKHAFFIVYNSLQN